MDKDYFFKNFIYSKLTKNKIKKKKSQPEPADEILGKSITQRLNLNSNKDFNKDQ